DDDLVILLTQRVDLALLALGQGGDAVCQLTHHTAQPFDFLAALARPTQFWRSLRGSVGNARAHRQSQLPYRSSRGPAYAAGLRHRRSERHSAGASSPPDSAGNLSIR